MGYEPFISASLLDSLIISVTGPKGRLQMGAWTAGGDLKTNNLYIRANQGQSIGFVREERVAKVMHDTDELLESISNLWHATHIESVCLLYTSPSPRD